MGKNRTWIFIQAHSSGGPFLTFFGHQCDFQKLHFSKNNREIRAPLWTTAWKYVSDFFSNKTLYLFWYLNSPSKVQTYVLLHRWSWMEISPARKTHTHLRCTFVNLAIEISHKMRERPLLRIYSLICEISFLLYYLVCIVCPHTHTKKRNAS